jgi:hypothetical protein
MRRVVTLGAAALAFALALCTPAHAQQVETRVFDYEWLVIRLPQFMTNFEFGGLIFIQEVASAGRPNRGLFEGSLTVNGGPKQFDCVNATIASGADILQVGPLAQQATINGTQFWTGSRLTPPPPVHLRRRVSRSYAPGEDYISAVRPVTTPSRTTARTACPQTWAVRTRRPAGAAPSSAK